MEDVIFILLDLDPKASGKARGGHGGVGRERQFHRRLIIRI